MSDENMLDALNHPDPDITSVLALPEGGFGLTMAMLEHSVAGTADEEWLPAYVKGLAQAHKFGYVYIIEGTHNGVTRHKIGKANNLRDRVKTFNVKLPFDIKVVASFYVRNAFDLESELHERMRDVRIAGEWFNLPPDLLHNLCLRGMAREMRDIGVMMQADVARMNKGREMRDGEYIEYLESILVMHNIQFSREVKDHGSQIISDGSGVG